MRNSRRRPQRVSVVEALEAKQLLDAIGLFTNPVTTQTPDQVTLVSLGDFDNDGDLYAALAMTNNVGSSGISRIFRNDGQGHFAAAGNTFGPTDPRDMTVADFDRDGDLDLAITSLDGLRVWTNGGNLQFSNDQGSVTGDLPASNALAVDLNGDGFPDLASSMNGVFLNDASGRFPGPAINPNIPIGLILKQATASAIL